MLIGVVGKANVGKSTFFRAATLAPAETGPYPFVTIKANRAIAYIRTECPCKKLKISCNPNNAPCINGTRFVPFEMIDVAGLIPGAHEGHGLGNQFLDDIRQADCLIHVLDIAGQTDEKGNIVAPGTRDPALDVKFLEDEFDFWIANILKRNVGQRKSQPMDITRFEEFVSGLKINKEHILTAQRKTGLDVIKCRAWKENDFLTFASELRKTAKPIVIAANKIDLAKAKENIEKIKSLFPSDVFIPVCAEAELALKEANEKRLIEYIPGDSDFKTIGDLSEKQNSALNFVKEKILKVWGSTGVQLCLNETVLKKIKYIAVFPVEDENKLTNNEGKVLPDAFLLPENSTALDLAFKIHTDIGKSFIGAINCISKRKIGKETQLMNGDVIRILTKK